MKKFIIVEVLPNLVTKRNHYTITIDKRKFPRTMYKLIKWMQNPEICSGYIMDQSYKRYLWKLRRRSILIDERFEDFIINFKTKSL